MKTTIKRIILIALAALSTNSYPLELWKCFASGFFIGGVSISTGLYVYNTINKKRLKNNLRSLEMQIIKESFIAAVEDGKNGRNKFYPDTHRLQSEWRDCNRQLYGLNWDKRNKVTSINEYKIQIKNHNESTL